MTQPPAASGPLVTPRFVAVRLAIVALFIAAAAMGPLLHGGALPALRLAPPGLHAPRLGLIAAAPAVVRLHIAAALTAFVIGCVLLAGVKGSAAHKALGWTWVAAMMVAALGSFFIRVVNPGHWSLVHVLSGWVAISVPMGIVAVRRGKVAMHRRVMTGQFVGGLVIAGLFTFAPGRLMWAVFFG